MGCAGTSSTGTSSTTPQTEHGHVLHRRLCSTVVMKKCLLPYIYISYSCVIALYPQRPLRLANLRVHPQRCKLQCPKIKTPSKPALSQVPLGFCAAVQLSADPSQATEPSEISGNHICPAFWCLVHNSSISRRSGSWRNGCGKAGYICVLFQCSYTYIYIQYVYTCVCI